MHHIAFQLKLCISHHNSPKEMDPSTYEITYRMLVDLNLSSLVLVWSMMRIARIFSELHRAKIFSTLDLWLGYYNITVDESSRNIQPLQQNIITDIIYSRSERKHQAHNRQVFNHIYRKNIKGTLPWTLTIIQGYHCW